MKQVFQDLKNGRTYINNIPIPSIKKNEVLVKSICSLISPGTENMLLQFGKASPLGKALQQQDKFKDILNKISSDGLLETFEAVKNKIDQPLPLGYCNVGEIIKVGKGVRNLKIGDRVASNGPHAEIFAVNQNLCACLPDNVSNDSAVFTVIASIGLQGIRLANPTFGETFLVSGLGLIGLLTSQLLIAQGCKVLGVDPDEERCALARSYGVDALNISNNIDQVSWCFSKTGNLGIDGAIITAATNSSEPINLSAKSCRKRGRVILVGSTLINLKRDIFYKKEITFQVSCSYGPGRYDKSYEESSNDYPIGFVRWTEQRNFQAVLYSLEREYLKTKTLISHRFPLDDVESAYDVLSGEEKNLGILIEYDNKVTNQTQKLLFEDLYKKNTVSNLKNNPFVGFIGSGNYASRVLIPAFAKSGANFHSLVSSNGVSPSHFGKKFNFPIISTDVEGLIDDHECNTVVISTRHDSHAKLVLNCLKKGKNIFVEKPLCLNYKELELIKNQLNDTYKKFRKKPILMVGFNRRFSLLVEKLKLNLRNLNGPKSFIYTINAGLVDEEHWIQDPLIGGGRLIGEVCHFLDLLRYLAESPIDNIECFAIDYSSSLPPQTFHLQIKFFDGSVGTINYISTGDKSYPKERLEVFCDSTIQRIDNFKKIITWGNKSLKSKKILKQDKGQVLCAKQFLNSIKNNTESPIPLEQIFEVQNWLLKVQKQIS
tara:strand:- start:1080 stop:3221 length:2142 start_codon:yes stop_codon:yes gene_type:complete